MGSITLPAKKLLDIVSRLSEGLISFDEDGIKFGKSNGSTGIIIDASGIKIKSGTSSIELSSGNSGLYVNGEHAVEKTITLSDGLNRKKLTFKNGLLIHVEDGWGGEDIT